MAAGRSRSLIGVKFESIVRVKWITYIHVIVVNPAYRKAIGKLAAAIIQTRKPEKTLKCAAICGGNGKNCANRYQSSDKWEALPDMYPSSGRHLRAFRCNRSRRSIHRKDCQDLHSQRSLGLREMPYRLRNQPRIDTPGRGWNRSQQLVVKE